MEDQLALQNGDLEDVSNEFETQSDLDEVMEDQLAIQSGDFEDVLNEYETQSDLDEVVMENQLDIQNELSEVDDIVEENKVGFMQSIDTINDASISFETTISTLNSESFVVTEPTIINTTTTKNTETVVTTNSTVNTKTTTEYDTRKEMATENTTKKIITKNVTTEKADIDIRKFGEIGDFGDIIDVDPVDENGNFGDFIDIDPVTTSKTISFIDTNSTVSTPVVELTTKTTITEVEVNIVEADNLVIKSTTEASIPRPPFLRTQSIEVKHEDVNESKDRLIVNHEVINFNILFKASLQSRSRNNSQISRSMFLTFV